MVAGLNIIINIVVYLFNLFLEIKYKIKRYFFKINHKEETFIEDIYFINEKTQKLVEVDERIINSLNELIKYSYCISLNNVISKTYLNKDDEHLMEIKFNKHNKKYIVNFPIDIDNKKQLFFPIYNINDIKKRNMNKISDISDDIKYLELIESYGGPLNDFYVSKDLGIPLKNIYSKEQEIFPFRNKDYVLEDIFLNEYNIGPNSPIKPDEILVIKNTLDNSKINSTGINEEFIMRRYKKFKINWLEILQGIFNWIFGKQKEL